MKTYACTSQNVPPLSAQIRMDRSGILEALEDMTANLNESRCPWVRYNGDVGPLPALRDTLLLKSDSTLPQDLFWVRIRKPNGTRQPGLWRHRIPFICSKALTWDGEWREWYQKGRLYGRSFLSAALGWS